MTDLITTALMAKLGNTLEGNTGAKITFRESFDFNYSQELKSAISEKTIMQDIVGDKQAMVLAIYNRSGVRLTELGIKQSIHKNHRFDRDDHGLEKRFITGDWTIQCRVSSSLRDIIEAVELNYQYWVKPLSHTNITINLDGVDTSLKMQYTTRYDESSFDAATYGEYGPMYILSFNVNVTGDLFLPQSQLYPKIKTQITSIYVGMGDKSDIDVLRHIKRNS